MQLSKRLKNLWRLSELNTDQLPPEPTVQDVVTLPNEATPPQMAQIVKRKPKDILEQFNEPIL